MNRRTTAATTTRFKALSARINLLLKGIKADPQHLDTLHELVVAESENVSASAATQ